jgi:tetrahydromethanopterin S-methyltransferase subunit F
METCKAQMQGILKALNTLQEREGVVMDSDSKPSLNFGLSAVRSKGLGLGFNLGWARERKLLLMSLS